METERSIVPATPASMVPLQLDAAGALRLREAFFAGRSPNTLRAYQASLERFGEWYAERAAAPLTAEGALLSLLQAGPGPANLCLLEYRDHLRKTLAPQSVNRHLSCLRSAVELAKRIGMVSWTLGVPNLKTAGPYKDTRGPGRNAVKEMLQVLGKRRGPKARRDVAVLRLLYDLGLRRFEVSGLDVAHVDLSGSRLHVLRKGKTERIWLTMPKPTVQALQLYLQWRGASPGPLFVGFHGGKGRRLGGSGVYDLVRKTGRRLGLKVRPHGIRHTAITTAVERAQQAGIGLDEIRDFSGHQDIRTLMVYRDKLKDRQGEIAKLVAATTDE